MRKTLNHETVNDYCVHACAMPYAKRVFQTQVSDEVFKTEWPELEEKYLMKYLDMDLLNEVAKSPH
eukprot:8710850-Lingulodinium_polyedra.AAC.1